MTGSISALKIVCLLELQIVFYEVPASPSRHWCCWHSHQLQLCSSTDTASEISPVDLWNSKCPSWVLLLLPSWDERRVALPEKPNHHQSRSNLSVTWRTVSLSVFPVLPLWPTQSQIFPQWQVVAKESLTGVQACESGTLFTRPHIVTFLKLRAN